MLAVEEEETAAHGPILSNSVRLVCLVMLIILIEIFLGACMYNSLKSEFKEEFLKELRNVVPKDCENRRFDIKFSNPNIKLQELLRLWLTDCNDLPFQAFQEYCRTAKCFYFEPPYKGRSRRSSIPHQYDLKKKVSQEAYNDKVRKRETQLIPPSIIGNDGTTRTVIVEQEGQNIRLQCLASGNPPPLIIWRRTDGKLIGTGDYQDSSILENSLIINNVNRYHMGSYECVADNGVKPFSKQTYNLEVRFPPVITVENQIIVTSSGKAALFECDLEAFPVPHVFWERVDGLIIQHGDKYKIFSKTSSAYKLKTQLLITNIQPDDFTIYNCVGENPKETVVGSVILYDERPNQSYIKLRKTNPVTFGNQCSKGTVPHKKINEKDSKSETGFNVAKYESGTYLDLPPRNQECKLKSIGKPQYVHTINQYFGAWMVDTEPRYSIDGEKIWVTNDDIFTLIEYNNKEDLILNTRPNKYQVHVAYQGNAHVVYQGYFFYKARNVPEIIRYDLGNRSFEILTVPKFLHGDSKRLYRSEYNYFDFSVDENGLWVIFTTPDANNTAVMKIDIHELKPQYIFNITLDNSQFDDMFVACGILYGVGSSLNDNKLFAVDLYSQKLLNIDFMNSETVNLLKKANMLTYDHKHKQLKTWNSDGSLWSYDVNMEY